MPRARSAARSRVRCASWSLPVGPAAAPRAADVDLPALAEQLELTGGSIRNIALAAAYMAAAEGQAIQMAHLRRAADGEYKKIGKLPAGGTQPPGNGRN